MSACTSVVPVSGANLRFEETVDFDIARRRRRRLPGQLRDRPGDLHRAGQRHAAADQRAGDVGDLDPVAVVHSGDLPIPVAASLPPCGEASATINFAAAGLTFDQSIDVEIEITADEIFPQTRTLNYTIANAESSFVATATKTWSFEPDLRGLEGRRGTFTRDNRPRRRRRRRTADLHCSPRRRWTATATALQSPVVRLSGTSTLSLYTAFQTEPTSPLGTYDRANVGMIDLDRPGPAAHHRSSLPAASSTPFHRHSRRRLRHHRAARLERHQRRLPGVHHRQHLERALAQPGRRASPASAR